MKFTTQFGTMANATPRDVTDASGPFRMAILGDFSGRAARGEAKIGDDLAGRRAIKFDIDTLESVIKGFNTRLMLPIGGGEAAIEVELSSIDDLHPDELFENVEIFEEITDLKQRVESGSDSAISELNEWSETFGGARLKPRAASTGSTVPANKPLSAFKALIGDTRRQTEATSADELIARIVSPHVVAAESADTPGLAAAVDAALSGAMRLILHHPEFQAVEAQWRTLDLLARRITTDSDIQLYLFDVSAEEIAADVSAVEDLTQSGLYRLLNEPKLPDGDGTFAAAFGLYTFEETPTHAELLGRIAQIAAHAGTPVFTSISAHYLDTALKDRHPLVVEAWGQLQAMESAAYLGLVSQRFMLRQPYGARSDPIYEFEFEEFTMSEGLSGLLWGNPVAIVAILLAATRAAGGKNMRLGDITSVGDMPFHFVTDRHGDQVALPCVERNMTEPKIAASVARGIMPLIAPRGRDEVRLGSFQSVAGEIIAGMWMADPPRPAPVAAAAPKPAVAPVREPVASYNDDIADDIEDEVEAEDEMDLSEASVDEAEDVGTGDAELDALLASFDDDEEDDGADLDLDAELAALLDDL
jgi:pilus assembly protein FimV